MMPYLQTAQTVANSTTVDQDAVDTATQNLNDAIAKLIPIYASQRLIRTFNDSCRYHMVLAAGRVERYDRHTGQRRQLYRYHMGRL